MPGVFWQVCFNLAWRLHRKGQFNPLIQLLQPGNAMHWQVFLYHDNIHCNVEHSPRCSIFIILYSLQRYLFRTQLKYWDNPANNLPNFTNLLHEAPAVETAIYKVMGDLDKVHIATLDASDAEIDQHRLPMPAAVTQLPNGQYGTPQDRWERLWRQAVRIGLHMYHTPAQVTFHCTHSLILAISNVITRK